MPAGLAAWELRKGIVLRLGLAIAALIALTLAWYAVDSDEPRAPLAIPAGNTQAGGPSDPAASMATPAQPVSAGSVVREEQAIPIGSASAGSQDKPPMLDPRHSEGIIRTLQDPAFAEKTEGQSVAPVSAPQPIAKPKLPGGAYLQVGVFTHPANAAELKAKLEAEGIPVVIATRVQVGPFKNRKEAEEMREKLKAMGMASIVINQ